MDVRTRRIPAVMRCGVAALVLLATACGGGGGGGGSSGGSASTTGSSFNTAEFQNQYGLAQANTLIAYGNNGNGNGITVGVVDSGIDTDHSEFTGRIASASTDIITNVAANVEDSEGHGTQVAGVIAAARNGSGMHGIAFSSTILAVKVTNNQSVSDSLAAQAINYAVNNGAKVINLSFGAAGLPSATLQNAVQNAVNNNVIVVAAAGNSSAAQSDYVARLANCTGGGGACNGFNARGRMIAVGAINSSSNEAAFNNRAGDTASAYLVAAGVNVFTTAIGGGFTTVSGTSFSAPFVTGAVAIILQRFPSLTAEQAVSLLLNSATDLGAAGTDTTFGRGRLNVGAAFQAQGLSSIPAGGSSGSTSSIPLGGSTMKLGSAFGNGLSTQAFLAQTLVLDGYGRPYVADLRQRVLSPGYSDALESFVAPGRRTLRDQAMPGLGVQVSLRPDNALPARPQEPATALRDLHRETLEGAVAELALGDARVTMGFASQPADLLPLRGPRQPFFGLEPAQNPILSLVDAGDGGGLAFALPRGGTLSLGVVSTARDEDRHGGAGDIAQLGWRQAIGPGMTGHAGLGFLREEQSLFRSTGSGAFGTFDDTRGIFLSAGIAAALPWGLTAAFDYSEAQAEASAQGFSLLSNWSRVRANAMAATLVRADLWTAGDQAGVSLSQPLRVHDTSADATLPVGFLGDGTIVSETRRLALAPTGRQTDLQFAYARTLGPASVGSFLRATLQPGHDDSAAPEYAAGLRLSLGF